MDKRFKTVPFKLDKDVLYLLSAEDSGLLKAAKNDVFTSFPDLEQAYINFNRKMNVGTQWVENANLIEKELGLKKNHIKNSMVRERRALAKLFNVK